MWQIAAAAVGGDSSQPIIVALISALGGVLVAVVGGLITVARREMGEGSGGSRPPLNERVAVLERRANDSDDRDAMQDRRLKTGEERQDDVERFLDRSHPDWRSQ